MINIVKTKRKSKKEARNMEEAKTFTGVKRERELQH